MSTPVPTVFVSHGSPMHALRAGATGRAWSELAMRIGRPRAILVVSAHWETALPMVSSAAMPETIHDFSGFPQELSRLRYAAPGAPDLAQRALALLAGGGLAASANGCRGLDHGAWVPLRYMYPDADVPVTQLSIQTALGGPHHLRVGRLLAPLAGEDVLVLGSGHMTHNLGEWIQALRSGRAAPTLEPMLGPAATYVDAFRGFVGDALRQHDDVALAEWRERAPAAARAHPTEEHFLPLLVAYGAAGANPAVERVFDAVDSAVLAMDAYLFTPSA
ncbi:MAG TPA: class III extradiol ring-cleavage dioxygenase [Burkholderiaceae bacterium]|nr:class III extradiol ring-cleavage dioxygenase [Burkholderiaceae bacterium]